MHRLLFLNLPLAFLFLTGNLSAQSLPNLGDLRAQFYASVDDSDIAEEFHLMLVQADLSEKPIYLGYRGLSSMLMAKHCLMPWNKVEYFNKGKNWLEEGLKKDPSNTELRFLRFCVQKNAPGFLKYNQHVKEDYEHLLTFLRNSDPHSSDRDLYSRVIQYFTGECDCHSAEVKKELLLLSMKWAF